MGAHSYRIGRTKTKLYRYDFVMNGQRYTGRGYESKRAALDAEAEKRTELKSSAPTDPFPTFKALAAAYLTDSRRTKSADWCYQLEIKLNKAVSDWQRLHPREITPGHVRAALDRIAAGGNGARSVNEYRKILRAVLNFAVRMKAIPENPAAHIGKVPETSAEIEPIPKADLTKLILAADPRMRALLIFLSQTGARWIEAARLQWGELHLEGPRAFCLLRTRKNRGGNERTRPQPLTTLAVEAIGTMRGLSIEYVFAGVSGGRMTYNAEQKRLSKLCTRLDLPTYGFHQVRHFAGLVAAGLGKSKKAAALFLGHTDTSATEKYMHAIDREVWDVADHLQAELAEVSETSSKTGENEA